MAKAKYTTFKELVEAFKSGELTEDNALFMDNDCCTMYAHDGQTLLFDAGGPSEIVHELLELLGIPSEKV